MPDAEMLAEAVAEEWVESFRVATTSMAYGLWPSEEAICNEERGERARLKPTRRVLPPSPCLVTVWLEMETEWRRSTECKGDSNTGGL